MPDLMPNETCDECGFDASRWSRQDAIRTVTNAAALIAYAVEGLADEHWNVRTRPDRWSIGEYVEHIGVVFAINRAGAELSLTEPDRVIPDIDDPPMSDTVADVDPDTAMAALDEHAKAAGAFFSARKGDDWDHALVVHGMRWTVAYTLTHLCHDLLHHMGDIASIRHELGDTIGPLTGTVAQINASDGGVPKLPIDEGRIDIGGLEGDRQATRQHHGRPWQAICLYSADVIDALRQEGHPIEPGNVGENLTLSGIDWSQLRSGMSLTVGTAVLRLSTPAVPCKQNVSFFLDGDFNRMSHDRHPGWSRWYASVVTPGEVRPGDAVRATS